MHTNTKRTTKPPAPSQYGDFTVAKQPNGTFKVFKQGKYCRPFDTLAEAEHYIDEHRQPRRIVLTPAS